MSTTLMVPSEEDLELLSAKGNAIYDQTLKALLEPRYNGQIVAIHLDSGDYEVAGNSPTATRALRARHGSGLMMITDIGPARIDSLTLRMLGSQILSESGTGDPK